MLSSKKESANLAAKLPTSDDDDSFELMRQSSAPIQDQANQAVVHSYTANSTDIQRMVNQLYTPPDYKNNKRKSSQKSVSSNSKSGLSKQEMLERINQQFSAMHEVHNLIDGEGTTPKSIKQFNPLYKAFYGG